MKSPSEVFVILYYFKIGSCVAQAGLKLTRQEIVNDLEFLLSLVLSAGITGVSTRPRAG